jgi:hypothetical protein
MALYRATPDSKPRYFDGGRYIIGFWDDALRIDTFDARHLKVDPNLSQVHTPSMTLNHFGSSFWAGAVEQNRLPLTMTIEGERVGAIDENWGYSAAADGHYERDIQFIRVKAALQLEGLNLWIALRATPVLAKRPALALSEEDRRPKELQLDLRLPLAVLPEMLAMNERQQAKLMEAARVLESRAR